VTVRAQWECGIILHVLIFFEKLLHVLMCVLVLTRTVVAPDRCGSMRALSGFLICSAAGIKPKFGGRLTGRWAVSATTM
jgi:hypothetical protein